MWQSAHATPDRACTPWFHISNSGCCAFRTGAPALGVRPVLEPVLLVIGENLVRTQPFVPRIRQPLFRSFEVVLDVALPAHVRAHLLPRRVAIDVVVLNALSGLHFLNALEEAGTRHAQLHRAGIVAVDAGHGVRHELVAPPGMSSCSSPRNPSSGRRRRASGTARRPTHGNACTCPAAARRPDAR